MTESAGVTCVSQAMVESLQDRYPALSPDKFCVVPCCPHVESFTQAVAGRDAVRRELGLQDKFVVSYLGSLVWYQLPEESLRVFRLIRSHCPQAHFLAITTDPDKMRVLTEQAGLAPQDVTIRSVPPPEVPRLLVASDLGLMLRDTTETNRVASPVKFGEYLAAGVPVAVSTHLGDCTGIVDRARLGVVVNLEDDDAALSAQLKQFLDSTEPQDAWRSRCQDYARQHLSWQRYLPPLGEWYGRLLAGSPSLVSAKEAR